MDRSPHLEPIGIAAPAAASAATTSIVATKDKDTKATSKRKKLLAAVTALALDELPIFPLLQNLFQRHPYTAVERPDDPPLPVTLYTTEAGRTSFTHITTDQLIELARVPPGDPRRLKFLWADIMVSDVAILQLLSQAFSVPDMGTPFSELPLERLETYEDHFHITLREAASGYDEPPHELKIFVINKQWIVTVHARPLIMIAAAARDVAELSQAVTSPWVVMYALLLEACTSTEPLIDRIYSELLALEELVLIFSGGEESDLLLRIANARTRIADTNMAALSKTTLLKELHAQKGLLPYDVRYMLEELATVQEQLVARLQLASSVLSNQTSTYLSRVSLHVAVNTEKVNVVMKKLNAISTIMLPLLAIQGIFSMNVKVPGGDVNNLHWFWGLCAVFVLSTIILFFGLKKLKWW